MSAPAQHSAGIARIRARFLVLLAGRQERLEHIVDDLLIEDRPDADLLDEARHILHRISGSAGTLGFIALGDTAYECEEAVLAHLESGTPPLSELLAMLDAFIDRSDETRRDAA